MKTAKAFNVKYYNNKTLCDLSEYKMFLEIKVNFRYKCLKKLIFSVIFLSRNFVVY